MPTCTLNMRNILLALTCLAFFPKANAQVLISLLFGDELNSGNVEFGLEGGMNWSDLKGIEGTTWDRGFHLGFYFDIKTKTKFLLHTGVIVKSPLGARDIPIYDLGNPALDSVFAGGSITRKLGYFNVPIMIKRQWDNRLFAEAGMMLGLRYQAKDRFLKEIEEPDDLQYEKDVKDSYHPLNAGLAAGAGYRLLGGNGMNIGVRYFAGLVDVMVDDKGDNVFTHSLYAYVGIPIGAGAAKANAPDDQ